MDFSRIVTRSYHKDLCKIRQGPLRGFQQDLHKILSRGPLQERTSHFARACAVEMHLEACYAKIYRKMPHQDHDSRFVQACALEMHLDIAEEPFYVRIYRKNSAPQEDGNRCVRASAVEMQTETSQDPFYARILRVNAVPHDRGPHFVREPMQSKCTWTCHKSPFYAEIYR